MRFALAILMALHGVAHLVGFAVPWRLVENEDMPRGTTLLAGLVDVGEEGIRMVGLLWLALAVAFFAASFATWTARPSWVSLTVAVAGTSLLFSAVGWPAARIGVFVNAAILLLVGAGLRLGWV